MNLWDYDVWSLLQHLTILLGGMLLANVLRRSIKPLRQSLIPSAVLGGFLVLLVDFALKKTLDIHMFGPDTKILETLTYHGLGLGVVAIALKDDGDKGEKKRERSTIFNYGVTVVSTYLLQGIVGLLITIGLFFTVLKVFPAAGLILPMGWGQGPGQAYNWGHNYEATWGFANGTSFGLTVAAMGFIAASIGGVLYLSMLKKKGIVKVNENSGEDEDLSAEPVMKKGGIPLSESMDTLTVQVALVAIAYSMAYLLMRGFNLLINAGIFGDFGYNTLQPLVWGFNFLFATFTALLLKMIMKRLKRANIIKREYTNDFLQNRFSGFMFDIMVVASIAAIDLSAFLVKSFMIPLVVMFVVCIFLTYWYCDFVCKRIFPNVRHESFLALFGMLTGTNSTALILLREIDPNFRTPVARHIIYQVIYASIFGFPLMLLMGYAPHSTSASIITAGILVVFFAAMNILLFRRQIFKGKKKPAS